LLPQTISNSKLKYDGSITFAEGKSRKELNWKNKEQLWSELIKRLSNTHRTIETYEEYKKMPKQKRDEIKDVGGFVGGALKAGRRKVEAVANRTLITLDLDTPKGDVWSSVEVMLGCSCAMYSTHSHEPKSPRLRLIVPLSRPVLPDEYQAIARKIAADIGIDFFDDTTYQPHRLMYWPSSASNGEYTFQYLDEPWLDPDEVLSRYPDWKDTSYWPESSRTRVERDKLAKQQGDPLLKTGVIGAFCRTYSIAQAIEVFLKDVYNPCTEENRYTYVHGSTAGGLILYNDEFAYSHHGTDPISGKLCNAFDLVRIHMFGKLDEDVDYNTSTSKLPSFSAMQNFASTEDKVRITMGEERLAAAKEEFDLVEDGTESKDWLTKLDYNVNGSLKSSPNNFVLILTNDENLKGKMAYNEFANRVCVMSKLPWRNKGDLSEWKDSDDSSLRIYISKIWALQSKQNCDDAFKELIAKNTFHPVRDYLKDLIWDGIERNDKLLIDYLGAEDTEYVRTVTRKWLCGAVARILRPGIKFDYMLVLTGAQGIYKSTFFRILAKDWFTDSIQDVEGNQAVEKLMNSWIIEFGELQAFSKAESNAVKRFVASQEDRTRLAYDRRSSFLKRQCVFAGTTNKSEFLKDDTGNRRYWPVAVKVEGRIKNVPKDLPIEVDQIWAEALTLWRDKDESIYLSDEQEKLASIEQEGHRELSEKEGLILEFLNVLLPLDWKDHDTYKKRDFFQGLDFTEGVIKRNKISVIEIWCECFGKNKADIRKTDSIEINGILNSLIGWRKSEAMIRFNGYGKQRYYEKAD